MQSSTPDPSGFLASLRAFGDGLLAVIKGRIHLFGVELQEEKLRLLQVFVWISAAVFAGVMAITFASLTLVYIFWEDARLTVLGGLALFYLAALVAILVCFKRYLARQPGPFEATLDEFEKDRECLRDKS